MENIIRTRILEEEFAKDDQKIYAPVYQRKKVLLKKFVHRDKGYSYARDIEHVLFNHHYCKEYPFSIYHFVNWKTMERVYLIENQALGCQCQNEYYGKRVPTKDAVSINKSKLNFYSVFIKS